MASTLIDGIYYNLNKTKQIATVTYKDTLYNSYSGHVIIPDSITYGQLSYKVTSIGKNAFYGCKDLRSIIFPNSLLSIGISSFNNCSSLTSITIPSDVTSIGSGAFENCENLTSVKLLGDTLVKKNYNTKLSFCTIFGKQVNLYELGDSITIIGNYAFYNCSKLKQIKMSSSLRRINKNAFDGCADLTSITIPSNVTTIGNGAFAGCKSLTSVTLIGDTLVKKNYTKKSSLNTIFGSQVTCYTLGDSITAIGNYAFYGSSSLTSIIIPSNVTTIGTDVFGDCKALSSVTLLGNALVTKDYNSKFSLESIFGEQVTHYVVEGDITKIGNYAFFGCSNLKSIILPNSIDSIGKYAFSGCKTLQIFDTPNVIAIGEGAFERCSSLSSITISNELTKIENSVFQDCTSLLSFRIPAKVDTIGNSAFQNCINLKHISITQNVKSIGSSAFQNCSNLLSIDISNSVSFIGNYAFSGCKSLTSIDLPNNLENINNNVFQYCTSLASVNIPSNVKTIGHSSFLGCTGLTSIDIPNNVTSIESYAFSGCTGLSFVNIPDSVTKINSYVFSECTGLNIIILPKDLKEIDSYAFSDCIELFSIEMPNKLETIGSSSFSGCAGLNTLTIPNSVKSINKSAFYNCTNLTNITISENVTCIEGSTFQNCKSLKFVKIPNKVTTIGSSAFRNCTELETIDIHNNVNKIESFAFQNCKSLKSISIPNLTRIEYSVFSGCTNLNFVQIPNSVTTIDSHAFSGCVGLISVDLQDKVDSIKSYAFSGCEKMASFKIPASVKSIGSFAFQNCTSLSSIIIPNNVTSIENNPFSGCANLTDISVETNNAHYSSPDNCHGIVNTENNVLICGCKNTIIPSSVKSIGDYAFHNCSFLTSMTITENVISIGDYAFADCKDLITVYMYPTVTSIGCYAFQNCTKLKIVEIPKSVSTIGGGAFQNCPMLTTITLPDDLTSLGSDVFHFNTKVYVNVGTASLLTLWNKNITPYTSKDELLPAPYPYLSDITQTTIKAKTINVYDGYTYKLSAYSLSNDFKDSVEVFATESRLKGLFPENNYEFLLSVSKDSNEYKKAIPFSTLNISPMVDTLRVNASSISVIGKYIKGDAHVVSQSLFIDGDTITENEAKVIGLDPSKDYMVTYTIELNNRNKTKKYTNSVKYKTKALSLNTLMPSVVSNGNVIVSANSNIDDDELNVGFEWRESNNDTIIYAINKVENKSVSLYKGKIEGYISNLSLDKKWEYRPYYHSKTKSSYVGKWVEIDPKSVLSDYDPIVHTYSDVMVENNTAEVKGFVLKGTHDVTEQGFKYWEKKDQVNDIVDEIPENALIETNDSILINTLMTAKLKDLYYETRYYYVAFVTTTEGDTFYGDIYSFFTGSDPTGIKDIGLSQCKSIKEVVIYNMNGHCLVTPQRGINIIRMKDGTVRKVVVK